MDESKLSPIGQANLKGVREGMMVYRAFEETCKRAMAVNTELLMKILQDNKDTAYGRKYDFASIKTIEDYQKKVPLITYEDIKPYIDRMSEKGEENLLTAYPIVHFSKTSGTTGEPKRIPYSAEIAKIHGQYGIAYQDGLLGERIGLDWVDGKKISLMEAGITTLPSGHTYGSFSGKTILDCRAMLSYLFTSPEEAMIPDPETETRYLYARYALMEENVTGAFCVTYSFMVALMRYIEKNWQMLVHDIATGTIDPSIRMTEAVRATLLAKLQPRPERAEQLEKIFAQGFVIPIATKLWPRLQYLVGIGTGPFSVYAKLLRENYLGETVAQYRIGLFSSEGHFSVPLDVNSDETAFIPDSMFFEFLPLGADDTSQCVTMDKVEVGKQYELVCTNLSGLYRYRMSDAVEITGWFHEAPMMKYLYRINQTVSMMGEKTTEVALNEAIIAAMQNLQLGMEDFSVYADPYADPLSYQIFLELDDLPAGLTTSAIAQEVDKQIGKANPSYGNKVGRGILGQANVHLLPRGTYQRYYYEQVQQGATMTQLKPPHILTDGWQAQFFQAAAKEVQNHDAL